MTDWVAEIHQLRSHLDGLSRFGGSLLPAECEKALRSVLTHLAKPASQNTGGRSPSGIADAAVRAYLELRGLLVEYGSRDRLDPDRPMLEFLLDRLISDEHLFLERCSRRPLDEIDPGLTALMRSDLRVVQHIARCRLGEWMMRVAGLDLRDPLAHSFSEPDPSALHPPSPCQGGRASAEAPSWDLSAPRESLKARFREADDWSKLVRPLAEFALAHGCGRHQGTPSFRLARSGDGITRLDPIDRFSGFDLEWFEGNESRVALLETNTRNMLRGFAAHNVLIWGPRGCGKSSLIRGLIARHYVAGLRGIEVPPALYCCLPDLFTLVRGRRESFIAVLDNISLGRDDAGHRSLASILDGGLQERPSNLVFYATSNFKDLIDREGERPRSPPRLQVDGLPGGEEASGATVTKGPRPDPFDPQAGERLDERRGLDDRFALKVFIDLPRKRAYEHLVLSYARRAGVDMTEDELLSTFRVWRMRHNHDLVGGRTARDFVVACFPSFAAGREGGRRYPGECPSPITESPP